MNVTCRALLAGCSVVCRERGIRKVEGKKGKMWCVCSSVAVPAGFGACRGSLVKPFFSSASGLPMLNAVDADELSAFFPARLVLSEGGWSITGFGHHM